MKFSLATSSLLLSSTYAFLAPSNTATKMVQNHQQMNSMLKMSSDQNDEVAAFRAAAAKARDEAERLSKVSRKVLESHVCDIFFRLPP